MLLRCQVERFARALPGLVVPVQCDEIDGHRVQRRGDGTRTVVAFASEDEHVGCVTERRFNVARAELVHAEIVDRIGKVDRVKVLPVDRQRFGKVGTCRNKLAALCRDVSPAAQRPGEEAPDRLSLRALISAASMSVFASSIRPREVSA